MLRRLGVAPETVVRDGYVRIYFDLPQKVYKLIARAADRQEMTPAHYLVTRALAQPIQVKEDF